MELPDASAEPERPSDPSNPDGAIDSHDAVGESQKDAQGAKDDNELDHRKLGEWRSHYAPTAWIQIGFEFVYLVLVLFGFY